MNTSICQDCGRPNSGTEFCEACGAFLAWDGDESTDSPDVSSQPEYSPAQPQRAGSDAGAEAEVRQPVLVASATQAADGTPMRTGDLGGHSDPLEPAAAPCPRCGLTNPLTRRFCGKCGLTLKEPVFDEKTAAVPGQSERVRWWHRWFRPPSGTRRAARVAYRRSLPLRYRLVRWLWGVVGLGAIVGTFAMFDNNPVGWIGDRWADLRGSLTQVEPLRAVGEPAATALPGFPAMNLVDGREDTAWAVTWSAAIASNPARTDCLSPAAPSPGALSSILLFPEQAVTVRAVTIAAGLYEQDPLRDRQWRPKTLQLAFSDGSCQQVTLVDSADLQQLPLDPVATTQIRISVLDAFSPGPDQPIEQISISEVQIFSRP